MDYFPNLSSQVNHVFAKYDKEKKGFLTLQELSGALQELGVDRDTCVQTANALDFDGWRKTYEKIDKPSQIKANQKILFYKFIFQLKISLSESP